jgi:magnesium transporter
MCAPTLETGRFEMRYAFEIEADAGMLREVTPDTGGVTVFAAPTEIEQQLLHDAMGVDDHTIASVLDPEEISRLELDATTERITIIWKRPDARADRDAARFEVASVGVFLDPGRLTVVLADGNPPIDWIGLAPVRSPVTVALRVLQVGVDEFLARLRAIRRTAGQIQARLSRTLDNRELVRMFDLSEDLLYYVDAIEANGVVLRRLRGLADRWGFTEADVAILDDLLIDNDQAARQGHIYSTVLGGLLDARGNIVNNNMNVLIKNLTVVNVVFLPLGVIASMGGMSEFTEMLGDYGVGWRVGYPAFLIAMVLLGLCLWRVIGAWIDRSMGNGSGPAAGAPVPAPAAVADHPDDGVIARAPNDGPVDAHY